MRKFITALLPAFIVLINPATAFAAAPPPNTFGGHNEGAVHFNTRVSTDQSGVSDFSGRPIHFNPSVYRAHMSDGSGWHIYPSVNTSTLNFTGSSGFTEGEHIGLLTVHRFNRVINVYEGETMRNMDMGAGRFIFTGANSGNTALAGHNRGNTNGFFSFVRHLQEGDLLTLEMNGITRTYATASVFIVEETDFSPLTDFGDNRLTLVTCVEYRPRYRRIAKILEV